MPDQDEYQVIDTQEHDGETLELAVEAVPEPIPEPEAEKDPKPEPEKTPEEAEEHKRLTGSARAKAKAERLAEENRQLKERLDRLESKVDPKPTTAPDEPGKPKLDDFGTFDEYNDALVDWKVKVTLQKEKAEAEATRQRQDLDAKAEKAKAKYDDFSEVMQDLPVFPPAMASVISASDHTADLLYHFGTNPDEYKRIASLPPGKQALEVAKLERGFEEVPTPKKQETRAPAPMRPTQGGSVAPQEDAGYVIY